MSLAEETVDQQETLPFIMTHLPKFYKEKAEKELNESPERIVESLNEIKSMAKAHKVTCDIEFVDDFLLQFLRQSKYDVPIAFQRIVNVSNLRQSASSLLRSVDVDKYFRYPSAKFFTVLPRRCPDGCTILIFEIAKWVPEELPVEDYKSLCSALFCQVLRDPLTQINGIKVIYDFEDITAKYLRYFTPSNLHLFYHGALNCLPIRVTGVYMVNKSVTLRVAWSFIRNFVPEKIKRRIFFKSTSEELLEHFPPSVLPVKYGGVLTDYHMTEWMKEANENHGNCPPGGQPNYY